MSEQTTQEQIVEMDINLLRTFKDHPFKVTADYPMIQLKESIENCGILTPLLVRPLKDGSYEIISGHRRKHAAKMLGLKTVPVIIRKMGYDDAIVTMVDANLQRDIILPSEKAFAYKMKYEAMRRNIKKKKLHPEDEYSNSLIGKRTVEILSEEGFDSPKQIQRYLKIADMIPEMLEKLDYGLISFHPAFEIAFLKPNEQRMLLDAMDYAQSAPSVSQAQRIKKLSQMNKLTLEAMQNILSEVKKGDLERVAFKSGQLRQFFPRDWTVDQMKQEILKILNEHMKQEYKNLEVNGGKDHV